MPVGSGKFTDYIYDANNNLVVTLDGSVVSNTITINYSYNSYVVTTSTIEVDGHGTEYSFYLEILTGSDYSTSHLSSELQQDARTQMNLSEFLSNGETFKIRYYYKDGRGGITSNSSEVFTYQIPQKTVQISCSTSDASIYYTTDGSNPSSNSTLYSNTFSATTGTTIKAIGIKEGFINSNIAELTI